MKYLLSLWLIPVLLFSTAAWALEFKNIDCSDQTQRRTCLLIQDGNTDGFVQGDGQRLNSILSRGTYSEVWLHSGGGVLKEGILVGEALRRHRMFVRVPDDHDCVSSCTVAFLGGLLRTVDRNASYEVHAYSAHNSNDEERLEILEEMLEEQHIELFFKDRVESEYRDTDIIGQLYGYTANMLIPFSVPRTSVYSDYSLRSLNSQISAALNQKYAEYLKDQFQSDLALIRKEGLVAFQEVAQRIERDVMREALVFLREQEARGNLGRWPRAENAIDILEIMFESRITSTAKLSQETLREYGYTNLAPQ